MAYEKLLEVIDAALKAKGLSERKALLKADVGIKTIYNMRKLGHAPKLENLAKLAPVLGLLAEDLWALARQGTPEPTAIGARERLWVKGIVQAGAWRGEVIWPEGDWYSIDAPADPRYPQVPRHGLQVRGNSMDLLFPEGSVVIVVRFFDLARAPRSGEKVVVLRRSSGGDFEATLKEYQIDAQGRHILWPRSSDPEFQAPIILPVQTIPMAADDEELPAIAFNYGLPDAGLEDLVIDSLVVGHYGMI